MCDSNPTCSREHYSQPQVSPCAPNELQRCSSTARNGILRPSAVCSLAGLRRHHQSLRSCKSMLQGLCARGAGHALAEMASGSERVALVQLARAGLQSPDEATLARADFRAHASRASASFERFRMHVGVLHISNLYLCSLCRMRGNTKVLLFFLCASCTDCTTCRKVRSSIIETKRTNYGRWKKIW